MKKQNSYIKTITVKSKRGKEDFRTIEQIMKRDLFTVLESDYIDLVANIMVKRNIRHVPVENDEGVLVGLVSAKQLIQDYNQTHPSYLQVKAVMSKDFVAVSSKMKIVKAIQLMENNQVSCLAVVKDKKLIGLVTEYDFVKMAAVLIQEMENEIAPVF